MKRILVLAGLVGMLGFSGQALALGHTARDAAVGAVGGAVVAGPVGAVVGGVGGAIVGHNAGRHHHRYVRRHHVHHDVG